MSTATVPAAVITLATQLNALEAAVPGDEFEAALEAIHIPTTELTWAQYSALPWVVQRWCRQDEEGLAPFFREAVALANIDPVVQQANAMLASRSYDANLAAVDATKSMIEASLRILG
jgi:hypothetical protein